MSVYVAKKNQNNEVGFFRLIVSLLHPACNKLVFFKIVRQNNSLVVERLMYCCLEWFCIHVWKWNEMKMECVIIQVISIINQVTILASSVSIITCFYITYSMIVSLLANIFKTNKYENHCCDLSGVFVRNINVLFFVLFSLRPYIWPKQCSVSCVKWQLRLNCHCIYM